MLTGHLPFAGTKFSAFLSSIFQKQPWPLASGGVEIPADWESVFKRALAGDPAQRFQQMEELVRELASLEQQRGGIPAGAENDRLARRLPSCRLYPSAQILRTNTSAPGSRTSLSMPLPVSKDFEWFLEHDVPVKDGR
jgi:hypothetical protein